VIDEQVGEHRPDPAREELHQVLLDLDWRDLLREPHPTGQSLDVRVDDHAFVDPKGVAQDDVGGLAADSGKSGEFFHVAGEFTVMLVKEGVGHADQVAGLVAEKPRRADHLLQLLGERGR